MVKKRFNDYMYALPIEPTQPVKPAAVAQSTDDDLPLSVSQLSAILGWSRTKIEKLRKAGVIPYRKVANSYPYYYLSEVKEALRNIPAETGLDSMETAETADN